VEETPAHRQEEIISTLFALFELFWTQGRSDDSITALLMALQYCEATDAAAKEHPALLSRFACVLYLTGRKPLAAEYLAEAEEMLVLAPVLQELKVNLVNEHVYLCLLISLLMQEPRQRVLVLGRLAQGARVL